MVGYLLEPDIESGDLLGEKKNSKCVHKKNPKRPKKLKFHTSEKKKGYQLVRIHQKTTTLVV
jgi:hypothetical protein